MRQLLRFVSVAAAVVAVAALGGSPADAQSTGLVKTLVSQLGITEAQAAGGAKAVFALAKDNLSVEDMGKLAAAVPEVSSLLGTGTAAAAAGTAAATGTAAGTAPAAAAPATSSSTSTATAALAAAVSAATAPAPAPAPQPAAAAPAAAAPSAAPAAAAAPSTTESALGAVAGLAGAAGGDLGSVGKLAGLTQSFSNLGMDSSMVQKFVPVVMQYVGGQGGGAADILKKGLGL